MNYLRPLLALFAATPLASATFAATEFAGDVPAEVVQQVVGAMFGGGSGPNEWEVRAQMNGPWDIARAFTYFSEQIAAQDWQEDVTAVGTNMATGSWMKTAEDAELVGTLIVMMTDTNAYDLRFRLVRKGPSNFGLIGGDRVLRAVIAPSNAALGVPLNAPALGIRGIPSGAVIQNSQSGTAIVPRPRNAVPITTTEIIRD